MPVSVVARVDSYQRRHTWLGFPLGVIYKYFDDRGPYLAALITYYAFVSLIPLMLLSYSILGFVLQGDPGLQTSIKQSVVSHFPVIGQSLAKDLVGFRGSGVGLAIGVLGTLYGGLGATQAAQTAFNQIYGVPRSKQPNPIKSRVRSLGLLTLLGSGVLISTGIAAILTTANGISTNLVDAAQVAGYIVGYVVNVALFSAAFKLLTARDLRLRQVVVGGVVAAALWTLIESFGSSYISHAFTHGQHLYGGFEIVLVTLAWFYLQSVILVLAGEINVVLEHRLWPRSLLSPFKDDVELTAADRRAYAQYAQVQRFKDTETVTSEFKSDDDTVPATATDQSTSSG
jgi:membrane protein